MKKVRTTMSAQMTLTAMIKSNDIVVASCSVIGAMVVVNSVVGTELVMY